VTSAESAPQPSISLASLDAEHAQLIQAAQQRAARLAVINQISRVISSNLHLKPMLEAATAAIRTELHFHSIGVLLIDPTEPDMLYLAARAGLFGQQSRSYRQRIDQGIIGIACQQRRYVLLNDVQRHPAYIAVPHGENIYSELALPIILSDRLLGAINLESEQPIPEEDARDLQTVADQLALAFENARLFDLAQERARRSASVAQITRQISRSLRTESILQDAVTAMHTHLAYLDVALFLLDDQAPDWLVLRARSGVNGHHNVDQYRQHISQGIVGEAVRTRDTVIVDNVREHPQYVSSVPNVRSELAVPIFEGNVLLGVLNVESASAMGEQDASDLQIIADQLRASIGNARQYENERRRTEHLALIARTGQRAAMRLVSDELFQTLVNELHHRLGYDHAALFRLDPLSPNHLIQRACATIWPTAVAIGWRTSLDDGVVGAAGRLCLPQRVNNVLENPVYVSMSGQRGVDEPLAELAVPIVLGDRLLGVLDLASSREFTDEDEQAAQIIADQLAVAIDNADLFRETQRALTETNLLYRTSQRMSVAMDVTEVITAYLSQVATQGRWTCSIATFDLDPDGHRVMTTMRGRWSASEGITYPAEMRIRYVHDTLDDLMDKGETVIIDDVAQDARVPVRLREMQLREGRPALAMIPLIVRGERIGLVILTASDVHHWIDTDLQPYQATAAQLATAIDSRRAQMLVYERGQQLAVLEERQRLARELHDSVTQLIFSTTLIAQSIAPAWRRSAAEGEKRINRLLELSQSALAEMRALLLELRPQSRLADDRSDIAVNERVGIPGLMRVQREGLAAAIRQYANTITRDGLQITLDEQEYPALVGVRTSLACEEGVYRIAQEALNNVVKHAHAKQVHIRLSLLDQIVLLQVSDDGHGFAMSGEDPAQRGNGIGLRTMRERAHELQGQFRVSSSPGQGTQVEVSIPWQETRIP